MTIATALRTGGVFSGSLRASSSFGSSPSVDTYGPSNPESLEGLYSRMSFPKSDRGAMGVGAKMTGIMASAAVIGSTVAGQALMAEARDSH